MKHITEMTNRIGRPVRMVQFGEGNFLRAFVDDMVDRANEAGILDCGIAVVKPIAFGSLDSFKRQECLYTVILRGREKGRVVEESRIVTAVRQAVDAASEFDAFLGLARLESLEYVVSNTTEAGIVFDESDCFDFTPPVSYPGKLTRFLFERWHTFSGDPEKGLMILPVELIENNGGKLKECVLKLCSLWKLEAGFAGWVEKSCLFCSTLVDRIVTGYPRGEAEQLWEKLGYRDDLLDIGEPFALWVIESEDPEEARKRFPLDKAGLPVIFTACQKPYRDRKVRILNGAHTAMVPAAFLAGRNIVRDCMHDPVIRPYLDRVVFEEILPTVCLPYEEKKAFAASVMERFDNPFIDHKLLSICLNSVSKWKARVLPSLLDYQEENGRLPVCLTFSFAALAAFYCGVRKENGYFGSRDGEGYAILDDAEVLSFFEEHSQSPAALIRDFASRKDFWGRDLTSLPGFEKEAGRWFGILRAEGAEAALQKVLED